ncbi:MAG TPA: hypothetical protein DD671_11730, partial [Balneolaceae bacterium]|nr:hypothetical protein [Balneolaceae bacterium]
MLRGLLFLSIQLLLISGAQAQLQTVEFDAEVVDHILVDAELSSTIDSQQRTHIAWISHQENSDESIERRLMYSVVDGENVTNKEVFYYGLDADLMAPSIILDDNERPHIVFSVQRDQNYNVSNPGNSAVYYAGDSDGNGSFEVSQVSENEDDPSQYSSDNIYDATSSASMRPQITLEGSNILIGYSANSNSETNYDDYYIFARKSGSGWDLTQEYILDDLPDFGPAGGSGMNFPSRMNSNYVHGWGDDDPFYLTNNGSAWEVHKVDGFEGVGTANRNMTFETATDDKVHLSWHSDANDIDQLVHAI